MPAKPKIGFFSFTNVNNLRSVIEASLVTELEERYGNNSGTEPGRIEVLIHSRDHMGRPMPQRLSIEPMEDLLDRLQSLATAGPEVEPGCCPTCGQAVAAQVEAAPSEDEDELEALTRPEGVTP